MAEEEALFGEKIRNSFLKVKDDINNQSNQINNLKNNLEKQESDILSLDNQLKEINNALNEIKAILNVFPKDSTGNNGVGAQWRTMAHNAQQRTMAHNDLTKSETTAKPLNITDFEKVVLGLTDREFSVFIAIYELGKEQGYTTYSHLAQKLNLTDSPIRHSILRLIEKGLPVERERVLNGKVSLFIKEGVLGPSLIARFMHLRQSYPDEQTTLIKS